MRNTHHFSSWLHFQNHWLVCLPVCVCCVESCVCVKELLNWSDPQPVEGVFPENPRCFSTDLRSVFYLLCAPWARKHFPTFLQSSKLDTNIFRRLSRSHWTERTYCGPQCVYWPHSVEKENSKKQRQAWATTWTCRSYVLQEQWSTAGTKTPSENNYKNKTFLLIMCLERSLTFVAVS